MIIYLLRKFPVAHFLANWNLKVFFTLNSFKKIINPKWIRQEIIFFKLRTGKAFTISFPQHWGSRPPQSDLLTTISMFDQIKAEPLHFYQSSCPPQITAQINPQLQAAAVLQQNQVQNQQHATVITINDDKDNLQANVSVDCSRFSVCFWCFSIIFVSKFPSWWIT